ncbi:MAG: hypothetical protein Q9222_007489 [Ikaeria aurantiellina]
MKSSGIFCSHEGNPDLYGLGIRVGIYLQLTTAILAKYFHKEAIPENLNVNVIFLLAVFIAAITATTGTGLRPEEIVIFLQLCFGFLFSVLGLLGGRQPQGKCKTSHGDIGPADMASFFRLTLTTAICVYAVWFWFLGKDKMRTTGCPAYIFIFTKVSIYGGVRLFFQSSSTMLAIVMSALFSLQAFDMIIMSHAISRLFSMALESDLANIVTSLLRFGYWKNFLYSINISFFFLTIVSVELTLRWNNITGVYNIRSTGQLIPFVISLIRLLGLSYAIFVGEQ